MNNLWHHTAVVYGTLSPAGHMDCSGFDMPGHGDCSMSSWYHSVSPVTKVDSYSITTKLITGVSVFLIINISQKKILHLYFFNFLKFIY